jgi:dihydroneopterin aldolase
MGVHGILEEERSRAQPFEIDLDVEMDLAPAGSSDDLAQTVDYGALAELAVSVVAGPSVGLLERLAEMIASAVLAWPAERPSGSGDEHTSGTGRVVSVVVSVRKLRPPVPVQMASAGVTIRRPSKPRSSLDSGATRDSGGGS